MSNATRIVVFARNTSKTLIRFTHGGLLAAGIAAVAHVGLAIFDHDSVSLADTGLLTTPAHAAVVELPETGDRWQPSASVVLAQRDSLVVAEAGLSEEMQRVRDWVSRRYRVSSVALEPVLVVAEESAKDAGLDPLLIVAMMAIESSFNPMAQSNAGAQGLMQVIPRWHMDKIGEDAPKDILFDPLVNIQVGTKVLVEGLKRYGTLQAALQYYGGARNDPEARYTKRVLAMKRQLASAAKADGDA
ncbi:lytic transglycosylase domain-containing protein [Rhodocyclaceae bacterium SMB388]